VLDVNFDSADLVSWVPDKWNFDIHYNMFNGECGSEPKRRLIYKICLLKEKGHASLATVQKWVLQIVL